MSQMKTIGLATVLIGAFASLLAFSPASGQQAGSALKGHNSNAPIDFAADRIEVQDRADRAVFSGNVVVKQADLTMTAQRLTVAYSRGDGIEVERLDASGGVTVKSPSETARGQYAIYDTRERLITLIGNVSLLQGDSRINGGRLVINLDSGRAIMDGRAGGTGGSGRVTGTFTVPQRGN